MRHGASLQTDRGYREALGPHNRQTAQPKLLLDEIKDYWLARTCTIKDCLKNHAAKGLCKTHYYAARRQEDPSRAKSRNHEAVTKYRRNKPEKQLAANLRWRNRNPAKVRVLRDRRRKHVVKATPRWVTPIALVEIYAKRPPDHHVDHIIPLRGENVCGLHVPWNLQYLPAAENLRKSNKLLY